MLFTCSYASTDYCYEGTAESNEDQIGPSSPNPIEAVALGGEVSHTDDE